MSKPETAHDEKSFLQRFPCPLIATNLKGAYAIPALSHSFDPSTASPDELMKNGVLWPRPSATDNPSLMRAWRRLYSPSRRIEWIVPKLQVQARKAGVLRRPAEQVSNTEIKTANWSGAVLRSGGPWNQVVGSWVIPTVSRPTEPAGQDGGWDSASWIGIDGFVTDDSLAIGVAQQVDSGDHQFYTAFFQWAVPQENNIIAIEDFDVLPGQTVQCTVTYLGTPALFGHVSMLNLMTNQAFQMVMAVPPGAQAVGETIEWILESDQPQQALPEFTPLTFASAAGRSTSGSYGYPGNGLILDIESPGGQVLTSSAIVANFVVVHFVG